MTTFEPDACPTVFNLIHHLLATEEDGAKERREGDRRPFRHSQWIAPGYAQEIPPESALVEVRCRDLTQGGFSFFFPEKPTFDRLVVAFRSPEPMYVAAKVVHCREVLVDDRGAVVWAETPASAPPAAASNGTTATPQVLVGCQFLRRLGA
jgi:hypothetical protein